MNKFTEAKLEATIIIERLSKINQKNVKYGMVKDFQTFMNIG